MYLANPARIESMSGERQGWPFGAGLRSIRSIGCGPCCNSPNVDDDEHYVYAIALEISPG